MSTNDFPGGTANFATQPSDTRLRLALLLALHIVTCCLSLVYIAQFRENLHVVLFDNSHLFAAVLCVGLFAVVSGLFVFARFSFGYFLGFYFYTMILGYLWIVDYSDTRYDHT